MSVEHIFHCDGPGCERHVQTMQPRPPVFMVLTDDDGSQLHFCGWDCVLRAAGEKEPETIVSGGPEEPSA